MIKEETRNTILILIVIILLGAWFRFYGLNWDQGQHFHPDERMITMVALRVHLPESDTQWQDVLTPKSSLNPHFFAYGSLPIYLLALTGSLAGNFQPALATYEGINLAGRFLSVLFDLGTLLVLFLLTKKLFGKSVGLLAAFFYALAVLPIQLSHFYAVDTPLTFFVILTLYLCIKFIEKPQLSSLLLIGFIWGLSLATKTSAIVLIIPIIIAVISSLAPKLRNLAPILPKLAVASSLLAVSTLTTFFISEPFALIDYQSFWQQTLEQQQMTKSAFTFPYTLQYVGKIPYWYEAKNIFLWGLGPILATLSFIGTLFFSYKSFRPFLNSKFIILNSFFWVYFIITGSFAIGFMRYMLPLYPLLCLFGAILLINIISYLQSRFNLSKFQILNFKFLISLALLAWPLAFISIYSRPNTRSQASEWIYQNISPSDILAKEHWDDGLPVGGLTSYSIQELPMYDPDNLAKWLKVKRILDSSDYLIIASNRLYTPLQKLTNCEVLPPGRCYRQTAGYYQNLFQGNLGFTKVAEFTSYPTLSIYDLRLTIDNFSADESFTVYDHPKVMIFQKDSSTSSKIMLN